MTTDTTQSACGDPLRSEALLAVPFTFPPIPEPQRIMGFEIRMNPKLPDNVAMITDGKNTVVITANGGLDRPAASVGTVGGVVNPREAAG